MKILNNTTEKNNRPIGLSSFTSLLGLLPISLSRSSSWLLLPPVYLRLHPHLLLLVFLKLATRLRHGSIEMSKKPDVLIQYQMKKSQKILSFSFRRPFKKKKQSLPWRLKILLLLPPLITLPNIVKMMAMVIDDTSSATAMKESPPLLPLLIVLSIRRKLSKSPQKK